jgi:NhaP-type Na+/H+ or K+/H+ antiporter
MDGLAMLAFGVFLAAYFLTKKRYVILLFLSGVSAGVLVGLLLAVAKINEILG